MSNLRPQEVERVRRQLRQEQRARMGAIANELGESLQAVGFKNGIKKQLSKKEVCYTRPAQLQTVTPYYRTAVGRGPDKVQGVNQNRSRAQKARRRNEGAGMSAEDFAAQEVARQRAQSDRELQDLLNAEGYFD